MSPHNTDRRSGCSPDRGLLLASLLSRRVRKVLKFARKFLAGHPLNGYHRTNATFTRGATKVLDPRGRAHPWHWRPG